MGGGAHFPGTLCAIRTLDPLRPADRLPAMNEPFTAPESREDVERYLAENDVEFLFAQFVDMHGKPSAKLVPAQHLDGLLSDGAGFAGFAAGAIGQRPNDHEDGNGQFEQNFDFADALTTCDRAIFFRYMVESLAQERGLLATFMPKPFDHLTGNGAHFHMSLWRDGQNLFEADPADDPRGMGLSPLAYNFIGGLKAHARAYIALTAPTVSSYKRLVVGTRSGSSWAPVYVSYGYNNRTQMLRIPAAGRIEDRTVDGS